MDSKQMLYGINLDDYRYPKRIRTKTGYVGTKEELHEFSQLMEKYYWMDEESGSVSAVIRGYFDGVSPRSLVEKYGEYVRPLEVLHCSDPIVLEHYSWQYKAVNDAVYPMYADHVVATRIFFRDMICGSLHSAVKGSMEGLRTCLQGTGWTALGGIMSGHPGTINYDGEKDIYELKMFVLDWSIDQEDMTEIIEKLPDSESLNMTALCKDIIAEGRPLLAMDRKDLSRK